MVGKSQMFTLISIIIGLMFGVIVATMMIDLNLQDGYVERKLESSSNYYSLLKGNYLGTIIESVSRHALYSLVNHTLETGEFLPSDTDLFLDIFRNLTYYGNFSYFNGTVEVTCKYCDSLMENNTVKYWSDMLSNYSQNIIFYTSNFEITPIRESITISQLDNPWFADVSVSFNLSIVSNDFNFTDSNYRLTKKVSILGLIDPFYGVISNGTYLREIKQDPDYYIPLNGSNVWTFEKLNQTINEEYYVRNKIGEGLSFLMRLRNVSVDSLSLKNTYIESFVLKSTIVKNDSPFEEWNETRKIRNFLDHRFFELEYIDCRDAIEIKDMLYKIDGISNQNDHLDFRIHRDDAFRFLQGEGDNWTNYLILACKEGVLE